MCALLSPDSATPLYTQLKKDLLLQIEKRILKRGDKLPSENELCAIYHVGRNTVRAAIKELTEEGFLVKKQGKGTFVQQPKISENTTSNMSFTSVCRHNNMIPSNKLIKVAIQQASPKDLEQLCLKEGAKVVYLARVLYANEEPVIYDQLFIHPKYSSIIAEDLDNTSFYDTLSRLFHIVPVRAHKIIELVKASEEDAICLGIKKGSPVLLMNETVYDKNDEPIHRTKQIILGDRFKYEV